VHSRAPIGTKHDREGPVPLQKIQQSLQASTYSPFKAQGLENIFRTNHKQLIKRGSSQGLVYQGTQPHPSPASASGGNSSPVRIHASPEGLLRQ
jgi:hypothetical protein